MSLVAAGRTVVPVNLVRSVADAPSYPGLERIGQKLARGLGEFLTGLLGAPANVSPSPVRIEEPRSNSDRELRHVRIEPLKAAMEIAISREAVVRLVDLYYGGQGEGRQPRERLSPVEDRFLTRIAAALTDLLPPAWLPFQAITAALDDDAVGGDSALAVQALAVRSADDSGFEIECRYPVAMLQAVPELQSASPAGPGQSLSERGWQARLMERTLDVPFPVRAIFAEPELPLARLIDLRSGDIIPICLPAQIGLSVSGLRLARGSAGESNGRAAICIEQI